MEHPAKRRRRSNDRSVARPERRLFIKNGPQGSYGQELPEKAQVYKSEHSRPSALIPRKEDRFKSTSLRSWISRCCDTGRWFCRDYFYGTRRSRSGTRCGRGFSDLRFLRLILSGVLFSHSLSLGVHRSNCYKK